MSVETNENVKKINKKIQEIEQEKNCENICNTAKKKNEAPIDMQATQRIVILSDLIKENYTSPTENNIEVEQDISVPEDESLNDENVIVLSEKNEENIIENSSSENSPESIAQAENLSAVETSENNVQETPNQILNESNVQENNSENEISVQQSSEEVIAQEETESIKNENVSLENEEEELKKKQKQHSQDKKDYRLEKMLFDRINTMQGKIKESLELIKKFERINAKEENLPNIVTTLHDKLTQEVIKQFRTVGIEFNMKSYLVQSIVSDLLNTFEEGISEFKDCSENLNFVREVQDDFESKVELAPTSKVKNIFARLRGMFKPERKQEKIEQLERERQEKKLEEANIHLIKYKFINNELERYTIRKNIVESLTREMLFGPAQGTSLSVAEFINEKITPEMTQLGLQEKLPKLEENLYESFKFKQGGVEKEEFLNMHMGEVKNVVKFNRVGTAKNKVNIINNSEEVAV